MDEVVLQSADIKYYRERALSQKAVISTEDLTKIIDRRIVKIFDRGAIKINNYVDTD